MSILTQPSCRGLASWKLGLCLALLVGGAASAESDIVPKEQTAAFPFRVRPHATFVEPGVARIRWETSAAGKGSLAYGTTRDLGSIVNSQKIEDREDGLSHQVVLKDLRPHTKYFYRLALDISETEDAARGSTGSATTSRKFSPTYELDTSFNYRPLTVRNELVSSSAVDRAEQLLTAAGRRTGIVLVTDLTDGSLLRGLAARSSAMIVGISHDEAQVVSLRDSLYADGLYGTRITLRYLPVNTESSFTPASINLIVRERKDADADKSRDRFPTPVVMAELLVPGNGTSILTAGQPGFGEDLDQDTNENRWSRLGLQVVRDEASKMLVLTRQPLPGAADWTHQYGTAANTTSTTEQLGNARGTDDLEIQWVGRPGGDFGIDRNPRMPAPLGVNGRLYHQGMERMVALDSYNGTVAWGLEIPDLQRLNIPRDSSNWCADTRRLYLAVKNHAWVVDGDTGALEADVPLPTSRLRTHDWGWIAVDKGQLFGSTVPAGSAYSNYWGEKMWFDAKDGAGTHLVCSDSLFAYATSETGRSEQETSSPSWHYQRGLILNPTITVDDKHVYFVENPKITNGGGTVADPALWDDVVLVALDRTTGQPVWEKPVTGDPYVRGMSSYYLLAHDKRILLVASNKKYYLYAFDPADGKLVWHDARDWFDDHHSGHFQRPVIVGDKLYLQPNGFDVISGEHLTSKMGKREGCHTYVGAGSALIFRGTSRQISMWDPLSETTSTWKRLRPSCWLSVIPAGGMLLVPEGGGGCSCGNWIETSVGMIPKAHLQSPATTESP